MSLMRRLMEARFARPAKHFSVRSDISTPSSSSPPPPKTVVLTGSCKALNPSTGRQCALPAGHHLPHRHGSTSFMRAASPGEASAAREQLDRFATATTNNPFTTGE